jgi:hypothetical protein
MNLVVLGSFLVGLIVNIIILLYVLNLENENCECSNNWKRDVVKYLSGFIIVINSLFGLSMIFGEMRLLGMQIERPRAVFIMVFIYFMAMIVYLAITTVYYIDLTKNTECVCSKNLSRHALIYPLVTFCFGIIVGLVGVINSKKIKFGTKKK